MSLHTYDLFLSKDSGVESTAKKSYSLFCLASATTAVAVRIPTVAQDLAALVSTSSSVSIELQARWSNFNAPLPSVVVNVTSEKDVAAIIKYCTKANVPFFLGSTGVLINPVGLNADTVSKDKKQATIGGGASIGDTIAAADAAGHGNPMGEIGFSLDNIISLRVATADSSIVTVSRTSPPTDTAHAVTTSYPDLFWALRGAGPNSGVVISATVNAKPATFTDRTAWINSLFFTPDKLPRIAQAIQDLPLTQNNPSTSFLTSSGPPLNEPSVLVTGLLRKDTDETGRAAFNSIYDLGPSSNSSAITPYTNWNDANIGFCTRGDPKGPNSMVLIERYNLTKARSVPAGNAAFNPALRDSAFAQAIVVPRYTDAVLDAEANKFGKKVQNIRSDNVDAMKNPTYASFAHGGESLEAIYGTSLPKLRELKRKWDPKGVFGQWFPIQ
ncbi:FAD-binding domain-containing protein [Macroventuria anomochaeta]|uniref:FAD-binding domain-containing protein n=1 Tax=Macroventuria anomochaeta TaxID=301207 RepID=A0ACB6RMZ9_9PLEO|nr:FAD-binding domain-containing protein [Macroventuria anomochaeta]KAF2623315.1 FAD-binding domain-containing protein [Macroventuria anomochaeta]